MNKKMIVTVGLIGILIFLIMKYTSRPVSENVSVDNSPSPKLQANQLTFLGSIPYWDQEKAVASFKVSSDQLDEIALFWYVLADDGSIHKYKGAKEDLTLIDFAHKKDIKVLALIANLPDGDGEWDSERVDKVISDGEKREKHIDELVELVVSKNFDGLNLDYENLEKYQREDFSLFVQQLANKLHQQGKILGVAIHPKIREYDPEDDFGSHAQDLKAMAEGADQLYFMTYEQHNQSTGPGPIASKAWATQVIEFAISQQVPTEKIYLGIPLYGYDWQGSGRRPSKVTGLEYDDVLSLLNKHQAEVKWREDLGETTFEYSNNSTHIVWFNDAKSVASKINLAKKLNLGGVHFWRLGREDPTIWDVED